jgi:hypothetical protein
MARAHQAIEKIEDLLADMMSLEDFEDWSASYIQSIHRIGNREDQELAHLVRSILNAFEDDDNESALRQELASAIRPFVERRVYSDPIVVGKSRFKAVSASPVIRARVA